MPRKIIAFFFILVVFLFGFLPVKDPDFGWHLVCGQRILEGQGWCIDNYFSYYLTYYKFYNPSFLYDAFLALFYKAGGLVGVAVFGALIFCACAFMFAKILEKKISLALGILAFLLVFALSGATFNLGIRSQSVSLLLVLFTVYLLQKFEQGNKWVFWVLPVSMVVWVNSHGGFFLGLVLVAFYGLYQVASHSQKVAKTFLLGISTFVATFANPLTYKIYIELTRHFKAPLNVTIAEWVSPPLLQKIIIGYAVLFFLAWLSFWWYKRRTLWEVFFALALVFFAVLSFKAVRNVPYFCIFALFSFLYYLPGHWLGRFNWLFLFPGIFLLFFGAKNAQGALGFNTSWERYCVEGISHYPCQFVKTYPNLEGNVFNTYEWGGFLLWQYPNVKVFIDGRMPSWKGEFTKTAYTDWLYILQTKKGWNDLLEKYHTNYILVGKGTFIDLELVKNASKYNWMEEYRDETVAFWKKIN